VLAFALLEPAIVINPEFLAKLLSTLIGKSGGVPAGGSGSNPGPLFLFAYYGRVLYGEIGLPGLIIGLTGLLGLLRKQPVTAAILISFVVSLVAAVSGTASGRYFERYMLPAIPVLWLLAGIGVAWLADLIPYRRLALLGAAAVTALLLWLPANASLREARDFSLPDTRTAAREFFEREVPHGSTVVLEGSIEHVSQLGLQLAMTHGQIDSLIAALRDRDPGKARYWELRGEYPRRSRYRIIPVGRHEVWKPLQHYQQLGARYAVVWPQRFNRVLETYGDQARAASSSRRRFLLELLALDEAHSLTCIGGPGSGFRGPEICVYRLF
jgi:hypothetical protein